MRLDEIKIPPKLQEWLTEFRQSPYFKCARKTFENERKRKTLDQLHEQYEHSLLNNRLGKVWMQLYADPDFAMNEILNVPSNPLYDAMDRRDFCCNLSMIMEVELLCVTSLDVMTTETFPRQSLLDFVGKISPLASTQLKDKIEKLWNDFMDHQEFISFITKDREVEVFNKQSVYRVLGQLISREVYTAKAAEITRILENQDEKNVARFRPSTSKGVPDEIHRIIKSCISAC